MPILLLDDNAVNAKLMETILKNGGYKTIVARTGGNALEQVSLRPDIQLVITDFMMPEMNGLEFLEKMGQLPLAKGLPVIMVSAASDRDIVMKAHALGCNSFLVRPVQKQRILDKVAELLQSQPAILRGKSEVMRELGIDAREYEELVGEFLAQSSTVMAMLTLECEPPKDDISEQLQQALTELAEGAAVVGADLYVRLNSSLVSGASRIKRSMCPIVLEHLGELQNVFNEAGHGEKKD